MVFNNFLYIHKSILDTSIPLLLQRDYLTEFNAHYIDFCKFTLFIFMDTIYFLTEFYVKIKSSTLLG